MIRENQVSYTTVAEDSGKPRNAQARDSTPTKAARCGLYSLIQA